MLSILHFDHFKKGIQTSTLRCTEASFRGRYKTWMCVIILPLKSFLLLRLWTRADCSHGCVLVSLVLVSFAICICMCRTRRRSLVITNLFATLPGCRFRIWFPKNKTKQNKMLPTSTVWPICLPGHGNRAERGRECRNGMTLQQAQKPKTQEHLENTHCLSTATAAAKVLRRLVDIRVDRLVWVSSLLD